MRVVVVRNPQSGRGGGGKAFARAHEVLQGAFGAVPVIETTGPGSATRQAAQLVRDGCDVVVAAGGDGTLSQVAEALVGSSTALGVLPLGTGNDFARTLGVPLRAEAAASVIAGARIERLDVGRWSQGDRTGTFINVAGFGYDAAVADCVNRGFRRLRGRAAYFAAIAQTLRTYRPAEIRGSVDGKALEGRVMLCAIANARCYGGGLRIAPTALLTDGLLDLVLVRELTRAEFVRNFGRVMKGTHLSHPKVTHRRFSRLRVRCDEGSPLLVDGELVPGGEVLVEAQPQALRVIVPPSWSER